MGNCSFVGADRNVYDDQNAAGLGALASREKDVFTRGLLYALPKFYHGILVTPFHHVFGRWIKVRHISSQHYSLLIFSETGKRS